jgi:hypothetical protein
MAEGETGTITGTKDKDYNIIWFTEACLSNVLRLETYVGDAEEGGRQRVGGLLSSRSIREPKGRRTRQAAVEGSSEFVELDSGRKVWPPQGPPSAAPLRARQTKKDQQTRPVADSHSRLPARRCH